MKNILILFFLVITASCSIAQDNEKRGAAMPAFKVLTSDSGWITQASLKKQRTLIIYFGTDCPHCQHLTIDLKQKIKQLGNTQILMVTWSNNYDIRAIKNFVRDFDLKKYPNITVATEGYSYTFQRFFKIETTPYIAVYDSNGKLTKTFRKQPETDEVIAAVKAADAKK